MQKKHMEDYKTRIRRMVFITMGKAGNKFTIPIEKDYLAQELDIDLEKIVQEIYEHGYEDGINEKEYEQEKEGIPWTDLD
jgi:hypothetical protein